MRRTCLFMVLFLVVFTSSVFAFSWNPIDWVKSGLAAGGWTALAYILTVFLGLAVFGTVLAVKIIKTLKEAGELLIALSVALSDRKVTADEIKVIIADIRDVFNIWKKTPDIYTSPEE